MIVVVVDDGTCVAVAVAVAFDGGAGVE